VLSCDLLGVQGTQWSETSSWVYFLLRNMCDYINLDFKI